MVTNKVGGGAVNPLIPGDTGPAAQEIQPKKAGTAAVQGPADVYGVKGAGDPFSIGNVRTARGLGELASAGDSITSEFPLDDLGKIATHGRQGAGFRLDSGSVRLMWINARRIEESDKPGYEMSLWLHGASIQSFKQRLEDAGATSGKFQFYAGDPADGSEAGKSVMKRTSQSWAPNGTSKSLILEEQGKFRIEFNPGDPKALEGALRIRVHGDDAESTKNLQELVKKLGLQSAFSPPTPNSLERFKLARFMWQVAPEAAEGLRWRDASSLTEQKLLDAFAGIGHTEENSTALKGLVGADLSTPKNARFANLAMLLLEKSPIEFLKWVKGDSYLQHGILPGTYTYDSSLNTALSKAGVPNGSEEYKAAAEKPAPSKAEARRAMLLGTLVRTDYDAALSLVSRQPDDVKIEDMKAVLAKAGIDPESDRVKNLRFEEVYPGYFTVTDPSMPDRLAKEGARYLYSTADNADRVFSMLSGGQKASYTRFQEGLLIQGKSSAKDFDTGGAYAVFTRLVTQSAIEKGKTAGAGSYSYGSAGKFNNWSGSRPYKVIINREILARTDWWGFNSDNYGKFTGLTRDNRAESIVKTINSNYSSSNELMFPIGNDPAYIDYVVCETAQQKQQLIDKLTAEGITSWKGKPLDELVRVEQNFFELPEDAGLAEKLAAS